MSWSWKKFFEVTGWLIGVTALIVGVIHVRELGTTTHNLDTLHESLSGDLRKVQSSISTQFAGAFPDFLDDVIATVNSAQHDLVILCDFPAYADFSDPKRALTLRQAIEQRAQSGVRIQLICLNLTRRLAALHDQFRRADIEKVLSTPQGKKSLRKYLGLPPEAKLTYDMFINGIQANDEIALKQTYRAAKILEVDADVPVFFWIADDRRGVMAVQTFGGQDEYGFKTSDLALVKALLATRDRYRQTLPPRLPGT